MTTFLNDNEIAVLIAEGKMLPDELANLAPRLRSTKAGHKEASHDLTSKEGHEFRIMIRQSTINSLDFSVILAYLPELTTEVLRLRRYNGKSHEHKNPIEGNKFYEFHIHTATERYQQRDPDYPDMFAESTNRYADLSGALKCLIEDCGFELPDGAPPHLI